MRKKAVLVETLSFSTSDYGAISGMDIAKFNFYLINLIGYQIELNSFF